MRTNQSVPLAHIARAMRAAPTLSEAGAGYYTLSNPNLEYIS